MQGWSVDMAFNIYHINEIHLFNVENFTEYRNERENPDMNHILCFYGQNWKEKIQIKKNPAA